MKWQMVSALPLLLACSSRQPGLAPGVGRGQPSDSRDASTETGASSSSSSSWRYEDMSVFSIRVESVEGVPMFHFERCIPPPAEMIPDGGWQLVRWIGHIEVRDVPGEGNTSYCWLHDELEGAEFPNLVSGWLYGAVPRPFQKEGACAPLRTGKKYKINVGGGGSGDAIFHIEDNGRIIVDEERCERMRRARGL
jgi:hypothetical protein